MLPLESEGFFSTSFSASVVRALVYPYQSLQPKPYLPFCCACPQFLYNTNYLMTWYTRIGLTVGSAIAIALDYADVGAKIAEYLDSKYS